MTTLIWPRDLFEASAIHWRPEGGNVSGGAAFNGTPQVGFLDGGPVWRLSLGGIILRDTAQLRTARALEAALDSGATPIDVGPCDCVFAPLPDGASFSRVTHSDSSSFSDASLYEGGPITAEFASSAALRAVSVTLDLTTAATLQGGEQFSVNHPTVGRRMYRVIMITGGSDEVPQVKIRPPLREAVTAGDEIDFNRPSCLMRLSGVGGFGVPIQYGRWAEVSAEFVEYFGALD